MIIEQLYDALREAGASEQKAREAAKAVAHDLVTPAYLDKRLAELKSELIVWMAGMLIAQGAVVATLVKLL